MMHGWPHRGRDHLRLLSPTSGRGGARYVQVRIQTEGQRPRRRLRRTLNCSIASRSALETSLPDLRRKATISEALRPLPRPKRDPGVGAVQFRVRSSAIWLGSCLRAPGTRARMAEALVRGAEVRTLDAFVEAFPNLMWIADRDGAIRYVNSRWVEYTGQSAEDLSSERGLPRGIVHPGDLERTWALWRRSLETSEAYEITYRLRSARDGSYRWFLARAAPVFDAGGEIVEWVRDRRPRTSRYAGRARGRVRGSSPRPRPFCRRRSTSRPS